MLEACGENCKDRKLAAVVMDLGSWAGFQQGDGLTWDPGEGRVNHVCSCGVGVLEGTMWLDHLLETYDD